MLKITMEQCRAARAMLDISQQDLAEISNLGLSTVRDFEKGRRIPQPNNLLGIKWALEQSGIEFIPETEALGPGVRLKKGV